MGGASVHLLDLASGMQNAGHDVIVLAGGSGILFDKAAGLGIKCQSVTYLKRKISPVEDVKCFFSLRDIFNANKPDMIHVHSSKAGILGRLAAKSLGIPVIFTAHGWAFTEGTPKSTRLIYCYVERFAAYLCTAIITVSDYDRCLALSYGIGNEQLITTVHNGMPDILSTKISKENESSSCKLVMVARFDFPKNHHDLLYALANIIDCDWSLDLIGDGPLFDDVKLLAEKLNINQRINFVGASNKVSEYLSTADVFVLISNWEGLPLTILEAMRAGLPVVASDVGGVAECVVLQKTGFLIDRGDIKALALSLEQLINSPNLRKSMGENSRILFETSFTFNHMFNDTLNIYKRALSI